MVMSRKVMAIACFTVTLALQSAVAAMRPAPFLFTVKELWSSATDDKATYRGKFGPHIIATNVVVFSEGDEVSGCFTPYHAIDYRLVLEFKHTCRQGSGRGHEWKTNLVEFMDSPRNAGWVVEVKVFNFDGVVLNSFRVGKNQMESILNYCAFIDLELGRIEVDEALVGGPLRITLRCVDSAATDLIEGLKMFDVQAVLLCKLPYYPLDM